MTNKSSASEVSFRPLDDLFEPTDGSGEKPLLTELPVDTLVPFEKHPFKEYPEEKMQEMVESVSEYGVLMPIDENGVVTLSDDYVIGVSRDIFGDKVYDVAEAVQMAVENAPVTPETGEEAHKKQLLDIFKKAATEPLISTTKEHYGSEIRPADKKRLERRIEAGSERIVERAYGEFTIETRKAERDYKRAWESYMLHLNECAGGITGNSRKTNTVWVIEKFTAHQLRHTYATMLFDENVDIKSAQMFLGHLDIEVTLNIYTHLSKFKTDEAIESLNGHLDNLSEMKYEC